MENVIDTNAIPSIEDHEGPQLDGTPNSQSDSDIANKKSGRGRTLKPLFKHGDYLYGKEMKAIGRGGKVSYKPYQSTPEEFQQGVNTEKQKSSADRAEMLRASLQDGIKKGLPPGWSVTYSDQKKRKVWVAPNGKTTDTIPRALAMSVRNGWLPADKVIHRREMTPSPNGSSKTKKSENNSTQAQPTVKPKSKKHTFSTDYRNWEDAGKYIKRKPQHALFLNSDKNEDSPARKKRKELMVEDHEMAYIQGNVLDIAKIPPDIEPILSSRGSAKYKGVTEYRNCYNAEITCGGIRYRLGKYYKEVDAAKMVGWAFLILHGKTATKLAQEAGRVHQMEIAKTPPSQEIGWSRITKGNVSNGDGKLALNNSSRAIPQSANLQGKKPQSQSMRSQTLEQRKPKAKTSRNGASGTITLPTYIERQVAARVKLAEGRFQHSLSRIEKNFQEQINAMEIRHEETRRALEAKIKECQQGYAIV